MIRLSLVLSWKLRSLSGSLTTRDWSWKPTFFVDYEDEFYWRFEFLGLQIMYVKHFDYTTLLSSKNE